MQCIEERIRSTCGFGALASDLSASSAGERTRNGGGLMRGTLDEETVLHVVPAADRTHGDHDQPVVVKDRRARAEQTLHETRAELRRLSGLLCSIQEDEKRRIALDLHDGLGQTLNLIKLSIENTVSMAPMTANEAVIESLRQIVPRIKDALSEVRRVAMELRPPMLDDLGILPTLSWFLREYEATCGEIKVERLLYIDEQDVPKPLKIVLFRILQEATNNIAKHAGATRVRVCLSRRDSVLHMMIEDNGRGFDPDSVTCSETTSRGLGLLSMKERASHSGGSYQLESAPGQGTRIQMWWPVGQDRD